MRQRIRHVLQNASAIITHHSIQADIMRPIWVFRSMGLNWEFGMVSMVHIWLKPCEEIPFRFWIKGASATLLLSWPVMKPRKILAHGWVQFLDLSIPVCHNYRNLYEKWTNLALTEWSTIEWLVRIQFSWGNAILISRGSQVFWDPSVNSITW